MQKRGQRDERTVDFDTYFRPTFVAVPDSVAVDVEMLVVEEEEAEPRRKCVDGHDEQDAHDPALLGGVRVPAQILVDLEEGKMVIR